MPGFIFGHRLQHVTRFLIYIGQRRMSHVSALGPFLDNDCQPEQLDDSFRDTEPGAKPPLVAMRQHQRSEGRQLAGLGPRAAPFQPVEQRPIGRREAVPDLFDAGDLDAAHARVDMLPVTVRTRDEMGAMAASFNTMQQEVAGAALALDGAREGLRQAQTDTRSALERLEAVIKASPLPIIAIDVDGTVEAWNPAAQHTFGWSEEEVRGLPVPFVPQEQQLLFSQNVERLKRGEALKDIEGRLCKKGGSQIDVGISGAPLRDADAVSYTHLTLPTNREV